MRVVTALAVMSVTGVSAFAPLSLTHSHPTRLFGMPPEEEMASNVREQMKIAERWRSIRFLSDEEAEKQLSGQELENFKAYHETIKADFAKMRKIAEMMTQEYVKIMPKTKKQRKRDKWARVQAQAAADLAAASLRK